jgi:hypothetical protein
MDPKNSSTQGQALVEYLFVLIFIVGIALFFARGAQSQYAKGLTSLAHVLGQHLTVGTCTSGCYFAGYYNGIKK